MAKHRDVLQLLERTVGERMRGLKLHREKLAGGLEARSVELVTACYFSSTGRLREFTCVVKRVAHRGAREEAIYGLLDSITLQQPQNCMAL